MGKSICVYCASSSSVDGAYLAAARELGAAMAARGHALVYGGGNNGLMGELAQAALAGGAHVTGVIPEALRAKHLALETVDELIVTGTMHERKAAMSARADAFIALPGGFGTFEEIIEAICHRQLELHDKPCVLLSVNRYFAPLVEQFERAFREDFTDEVHRGNYCVSDCVVSALDFVEAEWGKLPRRL